MDDDHHTDSDDGPAESSGTDRDAPRGFAAGSHALPGGLAVATDRLRLDPSTTRLDPGVTREWTYRILDDGGDVVTEFEATHEQLAHLILVRRDLTRFRHLHPDLADDGTWSADVILPDPGVYRAFVDVLVAGRPATLGVDLFASGDARYDDRPDSTREATADGYEVAMTPDAVHAGEATTLGFSVRRGGEVVGLDPYLGAKGHLVALREGDLAYLHVHPETADSPDGTVRFGVRFPTPGQYRLFLQAKPEGELITVAFDVQIGE